MAAQDFYIFLPSDSSSGLFPDNKLSEYEVELAHPIDLDTSKNWSVAVCDVILPAGPSSAASYAAQAREALEQDARGGGEQVLRSVEEANPVTAARLRRFLTRDMLPLMVDDLNENELRHVAGTLLSPRSFQTLDSNARNQIVQALGVSLGQLIQNANTNDSALLIRAIQSTPTPLRLSLTTEQDWSVFQSALFTNLMQMSAENIATLQQLLFPSISIFMQTTWDPNEVTLFQRRVTDVLLQLPDPELSIFRSHLVPSLSYLLENTSARDEVTFRHKLLAAVEGASPSEQARLRNILGSVPAVALPAAPAAPAAAAIPFKELVTRATPQEISELVSRLLQTDIQRFRESILHVPTLIARASPSELKQLRGPDITLKNLIKSTPASELAKLRGPPGPAGPRGARGSSPRLPTASEWLSQLSQAERASLTPTLDVLVSVASEQTLQAIRGPPPAPPRLTDLVAALSPNETELIRKKLLGESDKILRAYEYIPNHPENPHVAIMFHKGTIFPSIAALNSALLQSLPDFTYRQIKNQILSQVQTSIRRTGIVHAGGRLVYEPHMYMERGSPQKFVSTEKGSFLSWVSFFEEMRRCCSDDGTWIQFLREWEAVLQAPEQRRRRRRRQASEPDNDEQETAEDPKRQRAENENSSDDGDDDSNLKDSPIFLSVDLASGNLVGDQISRLLRVLPAPEISRHHDFKQRIYVPLEKYHFKRVKVALTNKSGNLYAFPPSISPVVVTLHVKPNESIANTQQQQQKPE